MEDVALEGEWVDAQPSEFVAALLYELIVPHRWARPVNVNVLAFDGLHHFLENCHDPYRAFPDNASAGLVM